MSEPGQIRVMHFIHSIKTGGAEQVLVNLINSTDPAQIAHAVCCFNDDGREKLESSCQIYKLDRMHKYDFKWREIFSLLSSWHPDIVHNWLPNVQANSFLPSLVYRSSRYLDSIHSVYRFDRAYRILQALVYLLSDGLVSVAMPESLFFPFQQIFKYKGGSVIPNGIPLERIQGTEPSLPATIQFDRDDPLLLYVGRLSPEKNIPLLLRSTQRLSHEFRGLRLVICGEGQLREQLTDQVQELAIGDRVTFLGYQDEVYPVMKACDLMVVPSIREGMALVIFEALAAGIPVVASRIPALEAWFGDQDIVSLFDPHSLNEITECIRIELKRSEPEKEFRRQKAERLVKDLDIDTMVRKYSDLYFKLVQ